MSAIYEPAGRAREYSPLALNYFNGCDHGCEYCYVPKMMGRFNPSYEHSRVKTNIDYKAVEASAKKTQGCDKQILLSFTGDPYCGEENGETARILEILGRYNHKVAILTKNPGKALKDLGIIKQFKDRIKIGSTLTFDNDKDSKAWETNAPTSNERITALYRFHEEGVKTWASFEPVIDPEQSLKLIERVSGFIDHIKIGKINNHKGIDKTIDWGVFLYGAVRICRDTNLSFYVKKDLAIHNKGVYLSGNEINEDYLAL